LSQYKDKFDTTDGFESYGGKFMSEKRNAAKDACDSNYETTGVPKWDLAGLKENNYIGTDLRDSLLVDVKNRDFRPKSNDVFIETGNGTIVGDKTVNQIGPYQPKGEAITYYAIPGRKETHQASHPIPRNEKDCEGEENEEECIENSAPVKGGRDALMFRPGYGCKSHTAYVSASGGSIPDKPSNTCKVEVGEKGKLTYGELPCTVDLSITDEYNSEYENVIHVDVNETGEYKWRVDCNLADGTMEEGEEWRFIVEK